MRTTKTAIKGIYPLNHLQQTLLIHSLSENTDQGFLQVQCKLSGPLDYRLFQESWQCMVELHPALRTSIHWEQIEKPVMVIHETAKISGEVLQWEKVPPARQQKKLSEFKIEDEKRGLNLSRAPLSRYTLIKLAVNEHKLIWSCHHIVFDGWSNGVILADLFDCYQALSNGTTYQKESAPAYRTYQNWLNRQHPEKAKQFWMNRLSGFKNPSLVRGAHPDVKPAKIRQQWLNLDVRQTEQISQYLKSNRVTLSSFLLSIWGILLGRMTGTDDVVYGITVSGRSSGFPGIERMTGLFMNVVPVRQRLSPQLLFKDLLSATQNEQIEAGNFDYVSQEKIMSWINWPVNKPLFNTLVIIQNLIWEDRLAGDLIITKAQGDLTTTYPLTMVARPGDQLELLWCYNAFQVDENLLIWLADNLTRLVELVVSQPGITLNDLFGRIPLWNTNGHTKTQAGTTFPDYQAPTNSIELKLSKIWEELFDKNPIGINDNFFRLGGQSIMAMRLVHRIEEKMGKKISPSTLIENPTISSMVGSWKDEVSSGWSSLVPMRAHGAKPPLFVVHGGGGHVFFYHPLTSYMDAEQPVYALQPLGLDGDQEKHSNIVEMARYYLEVIRQVQPEGPFSLLGTCFSDPVCYEMAQQLKKEGRDLNSLIIIDSAPTHLFPRKKILTPLGVRKQRFKQRFKSNPYRAIKKMVVDRAQRMAKVPKEKWHYIKQKYSLDPRKRYLLSLQENLIELYYQYQWEPFPGEITLIQTSQNIERINNYDDEVWKKLALGGVNLLRTPGYHRTRFQEPDVIELAHCLQQHLDQTYVCEHNDR